MLFYYLYFVKYVCIGTLIVSLLVGICAGYAYSVNAQRAEDDPQKRQYRPGAWLLAIFTWPILLPVVLSLFILRALVYIIFIVIFTILLILIPRKTSEPTWVESKMMKLGDALLEANTFLIKLMLRPWENEPQTI